MVVEILEKEMGHNDAFVLRVHYARMFIAVAATRIHSAGRQGGKMVLLALSIMVEGPKM